jgi:CheY-like chemotaxis protein
MAHVLETKRPTVLVVEDEAVVRESAVDWLEEAGFDVVQAADADEAIRILESRSDIRVVFTDFNIPGSMDGLRLAHAIRNRWPPIKLVVTSGRRLPVTDLPEGGRFVAKPYGPTQVANTVWELIA